MGRRLRGELAYYRLLSKNPGTPLLSRILLWLAIGYTVLPFDVIPDFVPVVGHLDDVVIVPTLVVMALALVPPEVREECRAKAGEQERATGGVKFG
jgi:uncharacterized membrane protein YkvA (DUF1232 family)